MSEETVFHEIIKGEIPADVVYEDELVIAFRDNAPVAPLHVLVVPKKTMPSLASLKKEDEALVGHMVVVAADIARQLNVDESGYRLVVNCGKSAGQTVFQLHLHLLGGRDFSWPPG